ncbi:MAG: protein-export chaperone SecB [Desulfotalea sp.]
MTTFLKLDKYFFPYIQVASDPSCTNVTNEAVNDISYGIKVSVSIDNKEDHLYQVTIEVKSFPSDEDSQQPYSIHLVAVGLFRVNNWEEIDKLLRVNGASILYSAAREFLITTSGRGPWGPVTLPIYSFLEHYNQEEVVAGKEEGKKKAITKETKSQ